MVAFIALLLVFTVVLLLSVVWKFMFQRLFSKGSEDKLADEIANFQFSSGQDFDTFLKDPMAKMIHIPDLLDGSTKDLATRENVEETSRSFLSGINMAGESGSIKGLVVHSRSERLLWENNSSDRAHSSLSWISRNNITCSGKGKSAVEANGYWHDEKRIRCQTIESEGVSHVIKFQNVTSSNHIEDIHSSTKFDNIDDHQGKENIRFDCQRKDFEAEVYNSSEVLLNANQGLHNHGDNMLSLFYKQKNQSSYVGACSHECSEQPEVKGDLKHLGSSDLRKPIVLLKEEDDKLECLWEHQDLIEQLKAELKQVKAIGLPTILEESECPKSIEGLETWKIDAKFLHENPLDELHKFYKDYRERMRKFDILNYQKMYTIGILKTKDPLLSIKTQKTTFMSFLSQNLWPFNRGKCSNDDARKFIKDLEDDLEVVYVAQLCLSWEFLRWQYEKLQEFLFKRNPLERKQYNQVAGEFQQFQVILQRFLEDEPFEGARVPFYAKTRCLSKNLLQVPVLQEDDLKGKERELRNVNAIITMEALEYTMRNSIKLFWKFIRAEQLLSLKSIFGFNCIKFQAPQDIELVSSIQEDLHKKEMILRDALRVGNCLVKRLRKTQDEKANQSLFFCQVDLKLISRILKMSKVTTDQLVWCHQKLTKITILEKKLSRNPSFLLFPC